MINARIDVPDALLPFVQPKDEQGELLRNAMMIYPFIKNETISYGRAAEILGVHKLDLIELYGRLGVPYFNQTKEELEEELRTIKAVMMRHGV